MILTAILTTIVLLAATQNILLTMASVISVAVVVVTIIALIVTLKWELGLSECLCIVIMIGLSIDYCVHLAMDYKYQPYILRARKMQATYKNMGSPILAGTISTLGAGTFLFGGKLTIFMKFGVCIMCTIAVSFIVSMVFFGALMMIVGPQNGCGDIFSACQERDINLDEVGYMYD